jgi:choline dehydrogenase-like flavoprotein
LFSGNTGWAYKYVLPYFKKSEHNLDPDIAKNTKYHSTGGYLDVSRYPYVDRNTEAFYKAFREIGYDEVDLSTEHVLGVSFTQGTLRNGERRSTNTAFLEPVRKKRRNLKVVTNVRVTKVLIDPKSKTAYGIEYSWEMKRTIQGRVLARKEVILSAGSFSSPQLLMLSGVGPKETLQGLGIPVLQDCKVGFNLQDHFTAPGLHFDLNNEDETTDINSKLLSDALKYIQPQKSGIWTGIQTAQVTANIKTKYCNNFTEYPDVQIMLNPGSSCTDYPTANLCYNIVHFQPMILRPKSRGHITIRSRDPFAEPLIYLNYFNASEDIDVILDSFKVAKLLGSTKALQEIGITLNTTFQPTREEIETGSNRLWQRPPKKFAYSIYHASGTCKMGPDNDPDAVVDPHFNVYGIKQLRVVDASIMPKIVSGNLNAAVIMIGEKGADEIKKSYLPNL